MAHWRGARQEIFDGKMLGMRGAVRYAHKSEHAARQVGGQRVLARQVPTAAMVERK